MVTDFLIMYLEQSKSLNKNYFCEAEFRSECSITLVIVMIYDVLNTIHVGSNQRYIYTTHAQSDLNIHASIIRGTRLFFEAKI